MPRKPPRTLSFRGKKRNLFAHVVEGLGTRIIKGDLAPGDPFPIEADLGREFGASRSVVREATERRGPHALPVYAIRLADDFHRFYHHHRVLESESQSFRLALCRAARAVIARTLDLVGVEAPERM